MSALRQLLPSSQSFIQQCVQQTPGEAVVATCTTPVTAVVTAADSSVQAERALVVSGAATPTTASVQSLSSLVGPGGANAGVVTLHSVGPAAVAGGATAGTVVLQTPNPLVTSVQSTVAAVSLPLETPVVSGAGGTLALPSVTFGEPSPAICLPSVKTVVTSAGTTSESPVMGAPVQITLAQPGPVLSQPPALPQAVRVKQLVSTISFLPLFLTL